MSLKSDEEKGLGPGLISGPSIDKHSSCSEAPSSTPRSRFSFSSRASLVNHLSIFRSFSFSLGKILEHSREAAPPCSRPPREPNIRAINETPRGYPKLAAFLDSDDNFMLYRRFGFLQSRLLLEKQDELRRLERELARMDKQDARKDYRILMTRRDYHEENYGPRKTLLSKIETKFSEYSQLLASAQNLTSLNKPSSGEYRSVKTWIENVEPVYDEDSSFIDEKEDLITLRPGREHAWLDSSVERLLRICNCRAVEYLFRSKETRKKTDGSGGEVYYTRERIESLVVVIITLMILVLLVVPVYFLYHLTAGTGTPRTNALCIGVLLVSTLAFSACISLFTRAKRHEILAASAGYCAVLVVFIGNVNGRGSGGFVGNS